MLKSHFASFKLCLIIGLLLISWQAKSGVVPNLYNALIPSQTQTDQERQELLKQGLLQVLERISGGTITAKSPQVKQALDNAADYVELYTYQDDMLAIKYSPELVNSLIQQMGQPVWGSRRPKVILWLAVEEQNQQRLLGAETDPALQTLLQQFAHKKGLPLILPLMDLQDVENIKVSDVWGGTPSVIQQASERYGAQVILIGKIVHPADKAKQWQAQWQLLIDNDASSWVGHGQSLEEILTQGIAGITQYLTTTPVKTNTTSKAPNSGSILISIGDIHSGADFNKVESYLRALNQVSDINVSQVLGQTVVFEVGLRGENARETLEQTINLDHYLLPTLGNQPSLTPVDLAFSHAHVEQDFIPSDQPFETRQPDLIFQQETSHFSPMTGDDFSNDMDIDEDD